jgi:hypothetical protein
MTISTEVRRAGPYTGNAVTTSFAFGFKVFDETDVVVTQAEAGVETVKELTTDYTVSLNADQDANPGGSVVMLSAPSALQTITITSDIPITQSIDLADLGAFYPSILNSGFDRAIAIIQQLDEKVDRSFTLPVSSSGVSTELPAPEANKLIGWNPAGTALANFTVSGASSSGIVDNIGELSAASGDFIEFTSSTAVRARKLVLLTQASMTALTADQRFNNMVVYVTGKDTIGDGAGGWWRFDSAGSDADNGGTVRAPGAGTGRWYKMIGARIINVKDFGAKGNGTDSDQTAVAAAVAAIPTTGTYPGAILYFPGGHYRLSASITVPDYVSIRGDGRTATRIDFQDAVSGSAFIFTSLAFLNSIEDMLIENTPADCIDISGGNHVRMVNLYIRNVGDDAIYIDDGSYMINMENIFIVTCGGYGVNVEGFATSVYGQQVFTSYTGSAGFRLNDLIYSSFDNCASDVAGTYGWECSNLTSVVFTACSGEANTKALFRFAASDALAANCVGGTGGNYGYIKGVVLVGCFGLSNATESGTSSPSFIEAASTNSRNIDIRMLHCRDLVDSTFQIGAVDVYASGADVPTSSIIANGETRIIDDGSELDKLVTLSGNAVCWRQNSRAVPTYGQHYLAGNWDTYINSVIAQRVNANGATFRGALVNSAGFIFITTPTTVGCMGIALYTSDADSTARNWAFLNGNGTRADLDIMQSATQGGNPASGNSGLNLSSGRNLGVGIRGATEKLQVDGNIAPHTDNARTNGTASKRWSVVYAGTGTINTSDERLKDDIGEIPDEWLDAWGDVEWVRYKWKDAIAEKGENARWHTGLIAQQIQRAFEARGLDAFKIGVLCSDPVKRNVLIVEKRRVPVMEEVDIEYLDQQVEDGRVVTTVRTKKEPQPKKQLLPAYNESGKPILDDNGPVMVEVVVTEEVNFERWEMEDTGETRMGVRYDEAQALEAAWVRRELKRSKKERKEAQ